MVLKSRKRRSKFGPKPGTGQKYPWATWLDGKRRTIRRGKDFKCSLRSMTVYLYQRATQFGVQVKVIDLGRDRLRIQAHKNGR